jgi:hypothetical protein
LNTFLNWIFTFFPSIFFFGAICICINMGQHFNQFDTLSIDFDLVLHGDDGAYDLDDFEYFDDDYNYYYRDGYYGYYGHDNHEDAAAAEATKALARRGDEGCSDEVEKGLSEPNAQPWPPLDTSGLPPSRESHTRARPTPLGTGLSHRRVSKMSEATQRSVHGGAIHLRPKSVSPVGGRQWTSSGAHYPWLSSAVVVPLKGLFINVKIFQKNV